MVDEIIDPEKFPFSEAEVGAALSQLLPADRAFAEAQAHAIALREVRRARDLYHAKCATGRIDTLFISYPTYIWQEAEVLASLARCSDEHAERVAVLRKQRAAEDRARRARQALSRATGQVYGSLPAAVTAQLDAVDRQAEAAWRKVVRTVDRLIAAKRSALRQHRT